MAQGDKILFKQGTVGNVDNGSNPKVAGQLLFATYQDSNASYGDYQGQIYFDLNNNTRIRLANDVDKARTIYSGTTLDNTTAGNWQAYIEGIKTLYDGLTIALKINAPSDLKYNTLTINDNIGPTLVWFRYNNVNAFVINPNSEVILTYRTNAGSYKPPTTGGPGTLNRNTTYTSGWVLNGVPQQSLTLYRPDQWNMNNAVSTQYEYDGVSSLEVPLGILIWLYITEIRK